MRIGEGLCRLAVRAVVCKTTTKVSEVRILSQPKRVRKQEFTKGKIRAYEGVEGEEGSREIEQRKAIRSVYRRGVRRKGTRRHTERHWARYGKA